MDREDRLDALRELAEAMDHLAGFFSLMGDRARMRRCNRARWYVQEIVNREHYAMQGAD